MEEEKQGKIKKAWIATKSFLLECRRVLRVTRKPDKKEFTTIVKISGAGILIIGLIGFLIHFAKELAF